LSTELGIAQPAHGQFALLENIYLLLKELKRRDMSIRYLIFGLFCGDKFLGRIWRYISISSLKLFGYLLKTQNIFKGEGEASRLPAFIGSRARAVSCLSLPYFNPRKSGVQVRELWACVMKAA